MADPVTIALMAGTTLMSVSSQQKAGKQAQREAEFNASLEETAAIQRETDSKQRLLEAMTTANAQSASSGIAAFEGSPLTILQQSIDNESEASDRDQFNARISALGLRARGSSARSQANLSSFGSLLKGGASMAKLSSPPSSTADATISGSSGMGVA